MGFLDKPMRYLPLQKEYSDCDVCGCYTLLLIPCSHWYCHNCGYDTRMNNSKISKLKKEYREIREVNQKTRQKQKELERAKLIAKWIKCVDCKYYNAEKEKIDSCELPLYCHRVDSHYISKPNKHYMDEFELIKISCNYGEQKL